MRWKEWKGWWGQWERGQGEKVTKNAGLGELPVGWDVVSLHLIIHMICVWIPVGLSGGVTAFSVFRFCGFWIGGGVSWLPSTPAAQNWPMILIDTKFSTSTQIS